MKRKQKRKEKKSREQKRKEKKGKEEKKAVGKQSYNAIG
jgi:hypothetical protein